MQILIVKTSSMGDLVHNCPVVTDIRDNFPEAIIDWVAEEAFQAIPALHPGVRRVIPVAWRRWRKHLFAGATYEEMRQFEAHLSTHLYDLTLDTQGLLKSAVICEFARSRCTVGGDWRSAREPLASLFYDKRVAISPSRHMIERCRALAARALGYNIETPPRYGLCAEPLDADWLPKQTYAVLIHTASRPGKFWPESAWLALARTLLAQGIVPVFPWGNAQEEARSQALARLLSESAVSSPERALEANSENVLNAVVPPFMPLDVAARFLAGARLVIGLDTGLTHFAAALGRPTIALYCDSDSARLAIVGENHCRSLGTKNKPPTVEEVLQATRTALEE